MPVFALIHLLSVLATAVVFVLTDGSTVWLSLVFSFGFVHYLLSLWYSRRQIVQVLTQAHSTLPLIVVLGAGATLYVQGLPLYLYFAVHHAFNEVYVRAALHSEFDGASRRLAGGVVFHFLTFALIITAQFLPPGTVAAIVAVIGAAFAVYMFDLVRIRHRLGSRRFMDLCTMELVMLALIPVSLVYRFELEQVVFYHVIFWTFYPLSRMLQHGDTGGGARYVALTAVTLGVFLFFSPIGPSAYNAPVRVYYDQFLLWAYVHITLSFVLSRAHPQWITTWFAPRLSVAGNAAAR